MSRIVAMTLAALSVVGVPAGYAVGELLVVDAAALVFAVLARHEEGARRG